MKRIDVFHQLNLVFEDIIDEGTVSLSEETKAGDIEGWDSLTNIQLIVATERRFDIKFTSDEILDWKNVGEMVDCIIRHLEE